MAAAVPARKLPQVFDWGGESQERLSAAEQYADTVGERELTGRAAAVAAALLLYDLAGLSFRRVATFGDRGDYWLESDAGMIEISGIRRGTPSDVAARVEQKVAQLFGNPTLEFGYVSVTMFDDPAGAVVGTLCHRTRPQP